MTRRTLITITAISVLLWALIAVVVSTIADDQDLEGLAVHVSQLSPSGRSEMCEMWNQGELGQLAVIQSLRVLNDSTVGEATLIARLACS